jgi:hypothetical protein
MEFRLPSLGASWRPGLDFFEETRVRIRLIPIGFRRSGEGVRAREPLQNLLAHTAMLDVAGQEVTRRAFQLFVQKALELIRRYAAIGRHGEGSHNLAFAQGLI